MRSVFGPGSCTESWQALALWIFRLRDEMLKAPLGSRAHRVIGFTGVRLLCHCGRRELREIGESDICVCFLSSSVIRGTWQTTDSTSTVCLGVVSPPLCCRYLENCDPTTAVWEWTGNPAHSPSLSTASFSSGMIVLWCTVHIFQITLSASPPTW